MRKGVGGFVFFEGLQQVEDEVEPMGDVGGDLGNREGSWLCWGT